MGWARGGAGAGPGWGREPLSPPGPHCSPSSSSLFCRNAAASLSLFYNNGARPCGCHEMGATGPTCEPFGGQCPCRAHVIGRDCSRCATGYWGFPNCRREYLGLWAPQRGDGASSQRVFLVEEGPPAQKSHLEPGGPALTSRLQGLGHLWPRLKDFPEGYGAWTVVLAAGPTSEDLPRPQGPELGGVGCPWPRP